MLKRYIDEYLTYLKIERGLSDASISSYKQDLKQYSQYLSDENVTGVEQITTEILVTFLQFLSLNGKSNNQKSAVDTQKLSSVFAARAGYRDEPCTQTEYT